MYTKHRFTISALPLLKRELDGRMGINLKELFTSLSNDGLIQTENRIVNGKVKSVWVITKTGRKYLKNP